MAKSAKNKKTKKQLTKKKATSKVGFLLHCVISIITVLGFIGYVVLYPIEKTYLAISSLHKKFKEFRLPKFSLPNIKFPKIILKKKKKEVAKLFAKLVCELKPFVSKIRFLSLPKITKPISKKRKETKRKSTKKPTKKTARKPSRLKTKFKTASAFLFGIVFTLIFVLVPFYAYIWFRQLPQPELLAQQSHNKATKLLDRKGRLLYEIYVDRRYDPVSLDQMPNIVVQSTLAIEDSEFYSHYGFRPLSMLRAAKSTLLDDELQGASTITQQLIKNVLLTSERTLSRKARELVLAVLVEKEYSKNEILEFYLNNIPYGGTAYGVQAAAHKYFDKDVWDLDLAEASMLAGLPSAPSVYSPVRGDLTLAKERQKQVLVRMIELGYITKSEAEAAFAQELVFATQEEYIRAPHFVAYVREDLYEKYGRRFVDFGGLTITTTLDLDMQDNVQQIVTDEIAASDYLSITNGAAVVLDSRSAGILAYVGSTNYFDEENDGKFDVATALRQPGSSIKPVTYALALERGYTAASILADTKITYQSHGQTYTPKNYDNKFHGNMTLKHALANSYNIPAVKLVNNLGIDNMVILGKEMGLTNWRVDGSYGLSVTLGGKEVRLTDLGNVFSVFARGGIAKDLTPFLNIKDSFGFEIYTPRNAKGKRVLKEETAYIITSILSDNRARYAAFGPGGFLVIPNRTVAVKTGTSNDIRDNLAVGYTPSYTVAVRVGNNDNSPMSTRVSSGTNGASAIWNKIFTYVLEGTADEPFVVPDGIIVVHDSVCGRSEVFDEDGKIPKRLCPAKKDSKKDKDEKKDEDRREDD